MRIIPKLLAYNQGKILLLFFGVFRDVNIRLTVSNSIFGLDMLTRLAQVGCRTRRWQDLRDLRKIRAVNPPRLQTWRIVREWVIDDVIMQGTWRHFLEKKRAKKMFNCNIWPNWFTSHQFLLLLILQWHTGVCEETFTVNRRIAQTTQNIWNFIVRVESTRNGKLRRLSGRFETLIWRPGETV